MISIFNKDESKRLGYIENVSDVCIVREINGEYALSFSLPHDTEKWSYISIGNVVECQEQKFRIYQIEKEKSETVTNKITCLHISSDANKNHIVNYPNMIGKTPYEIMSKAFENTDINVLTEEQAKSRQIFLLFQR